jgi:autotransporter adhesin
MAPLFFPCAAKVEQVKFDATSMHARPDLAAQHKMVDDGTGETEVRKLRHQTEPNLNSNSMQPHVNVRMSDLSCARVYAGSLTAAVCGVLGV